MAQNDIDNLNLRILTDNDTVHQQNYDDKCHVLNNENENTTLSRLLLCEATKQVMATCFHLLGINTLERI